MTLFSCVLPHFPHYFPISPHISSDMLLTTPSPNPESGFLGFWCSVATIFPQNIREFCNYDPLYPIFPTWGCFGGITCTFLAAGN